MSTKEPSGGVIVTASTVNRDHHFGHRGERDAGEQALGPGPAALGDAGRGDHAVPGTGEGGREDRADATGTDDADVESGRAVARVGRVSHVVPVLSGYRTVGAQRTVGAR